MKNQTDINNISAEKFEFVSSDRRLGEKGLETKPIGYLKDAWNRFKKNKGSVVAAIIIGILILFSVIAPMVSPYTVAYMDNYFAYCYPKSHISDALGINFWDGCINKTNSQNQFLYYYAMGVETGHNTVKNQKYNVEDTVNGKMYTFRLDSYQQTGVVFQDLTYDEYIALQQYQDKTGIQVIYPITDAKKDAKGNYVYRPQATQDSNNANYWYKTTIVDGKTVPSFTENEDGTFSFENIYLKYDKSKNVIMVTEIDEEGNKTYIYETDDSGNIVSQGNDKSLAKKFHRDAYFSKVFYGEGETAENRIYEYAIKNQTGFNVRINYYEYYKYYHTEVLKDGIKEPFFLFGTTASGKDILTCLGGGARLSFLLAICVSLVNLFVGTIYGAIEGYYGGVADMLMERFSDILSAVPFMIVITLLKMHMKSSSQLLILFIAFFLTGWISAAGRTRMQFYRFKNQEYVMASRTLGASDVRVMFKHIFPNSLGTLITSTVLVIPGMIFSESSLSYLGIINLETGSLTSVGTMLSAADPYLATYPYMMLFPAVFISLLMLSFNLFGNGLRDAFNPSLRGTED